MNDIKIFGLSSARTFSEKIANYLDIPLSAHTEKLFEDGEIYLKSDTNVRQCDVYVISSLYLTKDSTPSEKFMRLLMFIGSLRDASAGTITAVLPYSIFSRMDRKTQPREPIATKYIAQLLESVSTNRVITCDIHNLSSQQNSFRINTDNLEAKGLFAEYIAATIKNKDNIVVLSPDAGGMARASRFRNSLSKLLDKKVDLAYLDKSRINGNVYGNHIVGDIKDKQVIIIDDMISSASTIKQCVDAVKTHGGIIWAAAATHGLFVGRANENLADLNKIIITDTVDRLENLDKKILSKVEIVSTTEMFAKAIRRTNQGGSISSLLG